MMTQKALLPRIRFREFENIWELDILTSLAQKVWIGLVTTMTTNYVDEGGVPLIRNSDITGRGILESRLIRLSEEFAGKHSGRAFMLNDIATVHTGDVGTSDVIPETLDGAIGFATLNTRWHENEFDPYFIKYFFNTRKFRNLAIRYSTGDGRQNLNLKDFVKFHVPRTSLPEQQKIADFLSAVDKKIHLLQRKKELLEQYKKGVMQKIFSQEIRFKDENGDDYPDWEATTLGSLGKFYRGHTYSSNNVADSGLLVLRSSNIQEGQLVLSRDLRYVDNQCSNKINLQKDDIVLCMSNGSKRLVGKSGLYSGDYNGAITVGAFCSIYRSTSKIVKHVLKSLQYKRYLHVLLAGTNINNLKNSDMDNLTFLLPTDETETRQISYFLDVIEGKILQCRNNIESFSKFKKGLLQQMFV